MNPDKYTNQELFLDVGDGHRIYVMDWGNPKAKIPIIFLHGGPGGGCNDKNKRLFDPETQRVIFHDQRGAGKSLPKGSLENNTTRYLIADIEKLVHKLDLKKFILIGGSWGSTLALAYAVDHPSKVAGIVIDGVLTATQAETEWMEQGGWRFFFPDIWEGYASSVPTSHRSNPTAYHFKQALQGDTETAKRSVYEFRKMELTLLKLDDSYQADDYENFDPDSGKIEIHYLANRCFLPENHLLDNASKLKMPVYIIQGRYDMVCPPAAAYALSKQLTNGKIIWTINGHSKQHEAKNILSLLSQHLTGEE